MSEPVTSADRALEQYARGHLGDAERQIRYLRLAGMAGWAVILFADGVPAAPVVAIYGGGLLYTLIAHWCVQTAVDVTTMARVTSLGDPVLVTAMCFATGGVNAPFFPFYYFTLLATVLRYGVPRVPWILGYHGVLIAVLFFGRRAGHEGLGDLFVVLFHLGFAAALGAMLANWAQNNMNLALDRSDRVQDLLRQLIRTQEHERRAMARELHDRMSGHLFALRQGTEEMGDGSQARALANAVDACSEDVRAMMNTLHPTVLDDLGLPSVLEELVDDLRRTTGLRVDLIIDETARLWRSPDQTMLFRIAQEALLNVRKHADATRVEVRFERHGDSHELVVADDGTGVSSDMLSSGRFGVLTMRERANALGGRFELSPGPDGGTIVRVSVPG